MIHTVDAELYEDLEYGHQNSLVDVEIHGVVFEELQVVFNPSRQYEDGRLMCGVQFRGPGADDLAQFVHEEWHSSGGDVFIELRGNGHDFYLSIDRIRRVDSRMETIDGEREYRVAVEGWVSRDR